MSKVTKLLEAIGVNKKSQLDAAMKIITTLAEMYPIDSKQREELEQINAQMVAFRSKMHREQEDLGTPGGAPEGNW